MKAIVLKQPGGADQLECKEVELPVLQPGEVLIKVRAAAVNRTDIVSRNGKSGYLSNPILGVEVAGTIEDAASDVKGFSKGDRVMGLVNGGGYAQYVVMPADRVMIVPESLSFEEAAAIPEVFLTAYQTLFWLGKLQEKETVLIHAGGSGVGTAAIQLAKHYFNARVITTAGSKEKLEYASSLGADVCINYKMESFDEEVQKATENKGVQLILDFIGASYWEKNFASIGTDGRWVLIGLLGGAKVEQFNIRDLMSKRIQLTGTLLTPRSDKYKADLSREFADRVLPLFQKGTIKPVIDTVYTMEEIGLAHQRMEENMNTGKIILTIPH